MGLSQAEELIRSRFRDHDLELIDLTVKTYPGEAIFVVLVSEGDFLPAAELGNGLDIELADAGVAGFVTVRKTSRHSGDLPAGRLQGGVLDIRVERLMSLLTTRSRTSETQPSLSYVQNAAANLSAAQAPRHYLVFGRRGAGKTALLAEARKRLNRDGSLSVWINVQTFRREPRNRIFLWTLRRTLDVLASFRHEEKASQQIALAEERLSAQVDELLSQNSVEDAAAERLIPLMQSLLKRFGDATGRRLYIFLDDFHYVSRGDQPRLLDAMHGCVRDCDVWMKIAAIRHVTRWFEPATQTGLQTGHDADVIDLDLSLQDPKEAKKFLEDVLKGYAAEASIEALWQLFNPSSLDRLVLASGAVPRDYLVLAADSIKAARTREKAKRVGGQDVNAAAGEAAQRKINELQDDLASEEGSSADVLTAFDRVRKFCLDEQKWTYFRVNFKDKEADTNEYEALQSLLDLRLIHLIHPSVSHESRAGERFEVFMLDVSQYTAQRLRKNLHVLDLSGGVLVLKETGRGGTSTRATDAYKTIAILRRCPLVDLNKLRDPAA